MVSFPLGGHTEKGHRKARVPDGPASKNSWRTKIHPFYLKIVEQQNEIDALSRSDRPGDCEESQRRIRNPDPELMEEARQLNLAMEKKGGFKYKAVMTIFGFLNKPPDSAYTDREHMLGWLAWHRYGKTWKRLQRESRTNYRASQKVQTVFRDFEKWRFGKLDPEKMRF